LEACRKRATRVRTSRWAEEIGEHYGRYRLHVPEAERAMAKSLERYGQLSPVVVCRRGERYEPITGRPIRAFSRRYGHLPKDRGACGMPMKRLELLGKLSATPEGIEILAAMLASFTGRGVDRRLATLCRRKCAL
jgi:hypothetical protein